MSDVRAPQVPVAELPPWPVAMPGFDPWVPVPPDERDRLSGPPVRVRLPMGGWAWLFTRHTDVRQLLRHPGFSADLAMPGFPLMRPRPPSDASDRRGNFLLMDGADHARLRRTLTAEFMIKRVEALEPLIGQTVDRTLDAMQAAGPPADLMSSFALPVPSTVICHLLGVPQDDHEFFERRSRVLVDFTVTPERLSAAVADLRTYLSELIEAKRAGRDRDDLLGRIAGRVSAGELATDEAVGMAMLLLVAGHETTANMFGLSVLLLTQHPRYLDALRADASLAEPLVEELLRYLTILRTGLRRAALEDVVIGGHQVRAGEGVIGLLSLANRDATVFDDGDDFDPSREAQQHLAFGFGVHQCIGQPLARAELRIGLVALARRFPGLRVPVPPADVPRREISVVYGLAELPVEW